MKKIIRYFHLNEIGGLELLFAFYIILTGYSYGPVSFTWLVLLIMDIWAIKRKVVFSYFKPILYLLLFYLIHELIVLAFYSGFASYHINRVFSSLIVLSSVFIIVPALDYKKMVGSLYVVAIISMAGLLYHYLLLASGRFSDIHPLTLPFLPEMSTESRSFEIILRPTSFYWEPAVYATFMMVPLFLALWEKKYLFAGLILIFNLLSTSTNGIVLSFLMVVVFVFTQKLGVWSRILIVVSSIFIVSFLLTSDIFEQGVQKMEIESADVEGSIRLSNGPNLIKRIPASDLIFGIPAANIDDYYRVTSSMHSASIVFTDKDTIYVTDFWMVLIKYGIIGLFLYLSVFYSFLKRQRLIWPYLLVLLVAMFTQSVFLGGTYAFQIIFMLVFCRNIESQRIRQLGNVKI